MKGTIFDLTGRTALITGGSKGIGRAIAGLFAQAGADLFLCSRHVADLQITVNCIAPGPIATDMPMSILSPEQKAALAARTAFNRWGRTDEVAGPALLLASEAGSFITGTTLVVDGGVLARVF